jgi:hypothetical protein
MVMLPVPLAGVHCGKHRQDQTMNLNPAHGFYWLAAFLLLTNLPTTTG